MNLNPRFRGDNGREEFMAIVDMLVGVVSHGHFHGRREIIDNFSDYSADYKGIRRHSSRDLAS